MWTPLDFTFWRRRRVPLLLQIEAGECGLACLSMVAGYWGHHITLSSARARFGSSLKGVTLGAMLGISEQLGMQGRPVKVELEQLRSLRLPCVLHWDLNHFVVLVGLTSKGGRIHDPAVGIRDISWSELSNRFTGVALELRPTSNFVRRPKAERVPLSSVMGGVTGLRRGLAQLLLLGVALQICVICAPFYVQWTVDNALVTADRNLLSTLGLGFGLLVVIHAALAGVRTWITTVLSTDLNFQWLNNTFAHLMRLPLPYFQHRHIGDVISRFNSIQIIQRSITTQAVEGILDGGLAVTTLVMMLLYSVPLTGIVSLSVASYVLLKTACFKNLRAAAAEQVIHASKQNTQLLESIRNVQSVRLFDAGATRRLTWSDSLARQFNADLRVSRVNVGVQSASFIILNLERVLVVWLGAMFVLDGKLSVGMLMAFIAYREQFSQRVIGVIDKAAEFKLLGLQAERLSDIMHTEPERAVNGRVEVETLEPSIEFDNVYFRYAPTEPFVLNGVTFHIRPGESVAITGSSGCGKTTLIKLMLGLLEPTTGEIRVGGVSLRDLDPSMYRKWMGAVMQEDGLFAGTLLENITFFDPAPNIEFARLCAAQASLHEEIAKLPMSYGTYVGDGGAGLSGGQKQRLFMARALYRRPKILILDEATSHLDVANEQAVNTAIKQLRLMRVIVAHRAETIASAQRVMVLEEGRVLRDLTQPHVQMTYHV